MKKFLFAATLFCSSFFASAQDFTFGPDYYAMLDKVPNMTQQEFDSTKNTLPDGRVLYAFLFMKQKYEFFKKTGTAVWKFAATSTGSGFGINKTENGSVVFSKFYDDGGGEQSGFSKDPSLVGIDARSMLCKYFEAMCK